MTFIAPCGHVFHSDCYHAWNKARYTAHHALQCATCHGADRSHTMSYPTTTAFSAVNCCTNLNTRSHLRYPTSDWCTPNAGGTFSNTVDPYWCLTKVISHNCGGNEISPGHNGSLVVWARQHRHPSQRWDCRLVEFQSTNSTASSCLPTVPLHQ